ncbi:hypothetical protein Z043_107459 [Scleropages formosus]|uniref:Heparan-sulfate 6-O-sulfotransferase n=1 Tax=Scleropages formosus TaxID=113540 RepID=A0A0P7VIL3_SCLFO|nr:hypothetical protein Z043_107459 [Scleropages formosus]
MRTAELAPFLGGWSLMSRGGRTMVERTGTFLLVLVGSVFFMLILYQYAAPGAASLGSPHGYLAEEDANTFPSADPHYVKKYYFPVRELERSVDFHIKGDDVIVFLHIQKTGGTTFGRHLVQNVRLELPCDCRPGQKKCTCYRPNRKETWLFSRFSTGWSCGLHADWTELTSCVPRVLERRENNKAGNASSFGHGFDSCSRMEEGKPTTLPYSLTTQTITMSRIGLTNT